MNSLLAAWALLVPLQDGETKETFLQDHARNPLVLECLEAPTANCAIRAALTTAVEEQLAAEKSRVMIGVAKALDATGQKAQARVAADQARQIARSVGLSFTMQFRLRELVPMEAEFGNASDAMAMADDIRSSSLRDGIIASSAILLAQAGEPEAALVWLDKIVNKMRIPSVKLELATAIRESHPVIALQTALAIMMDVEQTGTYGERLNIHALVASLGFTQGDTEAWQMGRDRLIELADLANDTRTHALAWTWRAWLASIDGSEGRSAMVERALSDGNLLRLAPDRQYFARVFSALAETEDQVATLVAITDRFGSPVEKIDYLYSVSAAQIGQASVYSSVIEVLSSLDDVESAYDRDEIRLRALGVAIRLENAELGLSIVRNMEDDDSQARGLAEIAFMLG